METEYYFLLALLGSGLVTLVSYAIADYKRRKWRREAYEEFVKALREIVDDIKK